MLMTINIFIIVSLYVIAECQYLSSPCQLTVCKHLPFVVFRNGIQATETVIEVKVFRLIVTALCRYRRHPFRSEIS